MTFEQAAELLLEEMQRDGETLLIELRVFMLVYRPEINDYIKAQKLLQ